MLTAPKPFYEIEKPKRTTELVFHLIDVKKTDDGWTCMHTVPVSNGPGRKKRCPASADEQCEFCGMWTCFAHFMDLPQVWIEDKSGLSGFNGNSGYYASPCENCGHLSKEDLLKLRALRLELNQ